MQRRTHHRTPQPKREYLKLFLIERMLRKLGLKKGEETSSPSSTDKRERIARVTGLPVKNFELYERALRHASVVRHRRNRLFDSNERLEFLGDAVLGLATADYLFERFPDKDEGFLTRVRAMLVNKQALSGYADTIELQPLLEMSGDMDRAGGRLNPSLLANAFEALLGAIYIDHGYPAAREFILATIARSVDLEELAGRRENFKSLLLEFVQARGWPQPHYRVLTEDGPGHLRTFLVEVVIGTEPYGSGRGKNKKAAEQHAARAALRYLEKSSKEKSKDEQVSLTG